MYVRYFDLLLLASYMKISEIKSQLDSAKCPINDLGGLLLPPIFTPGPPLPFPMSPNNTEVKVSVVSDTAEIALT